MLSGTGWYWSIDLCRKKILILPAAFAAQWGCGPRLSHVACAISKKRYSSKCKQPRFCQCHCMRLRLSCNNARPTDLAMAPADVQENGLPEEPDNGPANGAAAARAT